MDQSLNSVRSDGEMDKDIAAADCHLHRDWSDYLLLLSGRQRLRLLSLLHLGRLLRMIAAVAALFPYPSIPTGGSDEVGLDAAETLRTPYHLL